MRDHMGCRTLLVMGLVSGALGGCWADHPERELEMAGSAIDGDLGDDIEALQGAIAELEQSGTLGHGQANALSAKVEAAEGQLARGNVGAALNILGALANQVEALVGAGVLTEDDAATILDAAAGVQLEAEAEAVMAMIGELRAVVLAQEAFLSNNGVTYADDIQTLIDQNYYAPAPNVLVVVDHTDLLEYTATASYVGARSTCSANQLGLIECEGQPIN